jgi:hypothetical protein
MGAMPTLSALPPWLLASAVSSFVMLAAGFGMLMGARITRVQPPGWIRAYAAAALVGVTTVGLHVLGEPVGGLQLRIWSFADTAANCLLALAILLAALHDFGAPAAQRRNLVVALALNGGAISHVFFEKFFGGATSGLAFASFGALSASQLALVVDYGAVIVLFTSARHRLPARSRRLLPLLAGLALLGLALAIPDGEQMLGGMVSWHALWHAIGALLLLVLWLLNELRFADARASEMGTR